MTPQQDVEWASYNVRMNENRSKRRQPSGSDVLKTSCKRLLAKNVSDSSSFPTPSEDPTTRPAASKQDTGSFDDVGVFSADVRSAFQARALLPSESLPDDGALEERTIFDTGSTHAITTAPETTGTNIHLGAVPDSVDRSDGHLICSQPHFQREPPIHRNNVGTHDMMLSNTACLNDSYVPTERKLRMKDISARYPFHVFNSLTSGAPTSTGLGPFPVVNRIQNNTARFAGSWLSPSNGITTRPALNASDSLTSDHCNPMAFDSVSAVDRIQPTTRGPFDNSEQYRILTEQMNHLAEMDYTQINFGPLHSLPSAGGPDYEAPRRTRLDPPLSSWDKTQENREDDTNGSVLFVRCSRGVQRGIYA